MRRSTRDDSDGPSHDSFLDIVANMVGILIILVLVVGVRVKNRPPTVSIPRSIQEDAELRRITTTEKSLRKELATLADDTKGLAAEAVVQRWERDRLAFVVAGLKHDLADHRRDLDVEARAEFDANRRLSELRRQLDEHVQQKQQIDASPTESTLVESYPTPLSERVLGPELHFQLREGRIAYVPIDQLAALFKEDVQRRKHLLFSQSELTAMVGPLDGFRLRYTMVRHDISLETVAVTGRGGSYASLQLWTLIPTSSRLGETLDEALDDGSDFRRRLATKRPGRCAITLWTYPDSFAAFRRLKKELYRLGFATAGRPLPHGTPISGSPAGSKSAAQ